MKVLLTTVITLLLYIPLAGAAVDPQLDNAAMTTEHNNVRASINAGTYFGQPVPTSPLLNYTNGGALNTSSQVVAETCNFAHSVTTNGENLFAGAATNAPVAWTENGAVGSWGGEAVDYTYSTNTCGAGKVCGHYTQVAWAQTPAPAVGCGATQCTTGSPFGGFTNWVFVVCQYSPAGNVNTATTRPYCAPGTTSPACALSAQLVKFSVD